MEEKREELKRSLPTADACLEWLCDWARESVIERVEEMDKIVIFFILDQDRCMTVGIDKTSYRASTTAKLESDVQRILRDKPQYKSIIEDLFKTLSKEIQLRAKEKVLEALSDGTQVTLRESGDEYEHYLLRF